MNGVRRVTTIAAGTATMLSVVAAVLATPAEAATERSRQDPVSATARPGSRGWVGLQVDFVASSVRRARSGDYTVVITGVVPESPAAKAGVQPGDTLMHINGSKASPHSFEDLRTGLRTGDVIQFAIRREGGDQDLHMTAASRPAFVFTPNPPELEFRIDSLRMAILRHADSLRQGSQSRPQRIAVGRYRSRIDSFVTVLEIETNDRLNVRQEHGGSVSVVRTTSDRQAMIMSWSFQFEAPGSPQAFETLVVRTPKTDSLKASILQLRSQIERVTRAELRVAQDVSSLIRPIQTVGDGSNTNPAHQSAMDRLVELQLLQGVLASRLGERETELRSATREELETARANARVPEAPRVNVRVDAPGSVAHVRPITPYLVGRRYLAGARVTDMNEGLSGYFGVSEGVLVTEVVDGTPAAENGFEAGDVIVAVDDEAVRDVSQLRSRLASQWAGVALTVLRRGEQVLVELSR